MESEMSISDLHMMLTPDWEWEVKRMKQFGNFGIFFSLVKFLYAFSHFKILRPFGVQKLPGFRQKKNISTGNENVKFQK